MKVHIQFSNYIMLFYSHSIKKYIYCPNKLLLYLWGVLLHKTWRLLELKNTTVALETCFQSTAECSESCYRDYYLTKDFIRKLGKQIQTLLLAPYHCFPHHKRAAMVNVFHTFPLLDIITCTFQSKRSRTHASLNNSDS